MAVTLVAGVSLYSGAMGDAMLRQRLNTDPTNMNLDVSLSGSALTGTHYTALDSYIRHGAATDLTLPLQNLRIHHNTTTVRVFRLQSNGRELASFPLASLALDYYQGVQDHVTLYNGDHGRTGPDGQWWCPGVYLCLYSAYAEVAPRR